MFYTKSTIENGLLIKQSILAAYLLRTAWKFNRYRLEGGDNVSENKFGNDILTLEDDEGQEHSFTVLDAIDNGENRYLALTPVYDTPEDSLEDSGELIIMRVAEVDGEEFLETIEDDDELDEIADIFMERLEEDYDIVDEDDE